MGALGVALLLYVVLLPGTGVVAQPVRERLPIRELTYTVEPFTQEDKYRLRVSLTFRGDSSGKTRLLLPFEWSAGVELYKGNRATRPLSEDTGIADTKEPLQSISGIPPALVSFIPPHKTRLRN